jgi:hypothetical protein
MLPASVLVQNIFFPALDQQEFTDVDPDEQHMTQKTSKKIKLYSSGLRFS